MQLATVKVDVSRHNVGTESKARVNTNSAKFFAIMSDGIYQDKIGSIVRELSCNALDSHIMAGKRSVPFQLHLPTELEPYFMVTDYGIGLDDDGVRDTYMGYLESTKDQSNECIGAFGLGSKSPFSYTDAFTVSAVYNGTRRIYSAFIGDDGSPSVAAMGEAEATDAPNGVEVMVPVVDIADFNKFRTAIAEQLRFFKVKPTITNGVVNFDTITALEVAPGIALLDSNARGKGIWIVQGGVGYPLLYGNLVQHLSAEALKILDFINQSGGVLEFDIGKIQTTASREGVQYSKYTCANIETLLIQSGATLISGMVSRIKAMPTEWERAKFLNANGVIANMINADDRDVIASLVPNLIPTQVHASLTSWGVSLDTGIVRASRYQRKLSRRARKPQFELTESQVSEYRANSNAHLVIVDTQDKPVVRLRQFLTDKAGHTGEAKALQLEPVMNATVADIEAMLANVGVEYSLLSAVVVPPRAPTVRTSSTYNKPSCYKRTYAGDKNDATEWRKVVDKIKDMTDGGYYVVIPEGSRFQVSSLPQTHAFIFGMADNNELDKDIFAIRERELKRIVNNPEWIPLQEVAQDVIDQYKDNVMLARAIGANDALSNDSATAKLIAINTAALEAKGYTTPEVFARYNKIVRLHNKVTTITNDVSARILAIVRSHNADIIAAQAKVWNERNTKAREAIFKAFPFLNYVSTRTYRDPTTGERYERYEDGIADHLAEYINRFS